MISSKQWAMLNLYKLHLNSFKLVSSRGVISRPSSWRLASFMKSIWRSSSRVARCFGSTATAFIINSFSSSETLNHTYSLKSKNSSCRLSVTPPVMSKYRITPIDHTSLLGSFLIKWFVSGARKRRSTPEVYPGFPWWCVWASIMAGTRASCTIIGVPRLKPSLTKTHCGVRR